MSKLSYEIKVEKWWGKESVILKNDCLLSILKNELCKELLALNILSDSDMDQRNKTPHIRIGGGKSYSHLENKKFTLVPSDIIIGKNLIEVSTPDRSHFSIAFKKNIGIYKMTITDVVSKIWSRLLLYVPSSAPSIIDTLDAKNNVKKDSADTKNNVKKEESVDVKKEEPADKTCSICMDKTYNCTFGCGHLVTCMDCGAKITTCPTCRSPITLRIQTFIG